MRRWREPFPRQRRRTAVRQEGATPTAAPQIGDAVPPDAPAIAPNPNVSPAQAPTSPAPWEEPHESHLVSNAANRPPAASARPLALEAVITDDTLCAALSLLRNRGQAPGLDGITYADLGRSEIIDPDLGRSEMWEAIRAAREAVHSRMYLPTEARRVGIPKDDGSLRYLLLRGIIDRAVSLATLHALSPIIDPILLPNVYGFRPRRSIWDLLASLCQAVDRTGHAWLSHVDIERAFDSVPIASALQCYARHIPDEGLMWLVESILRGHGGVSQTVGIEQGCPMSPITLNILLHHVLDLSPRAAGQDYPLWYARYADNLLLLCQSAFDGRERLAQVRRLLPHAGLRLKAQTGDPPINLRRQQAAVDILGFQARLVNDQLQFGIGMKAYTGLEESLLWALSAPAPSETARMVVRGWLTAVGPAVESVGLGLVREVRQRASRMGFREVGREQELEVVLWESYQRWLRIRATLRQG